MVESPALWQRTGRKSCIVAKDWWESAACSGKALVEKYGMAERSAWWGSTGIKVVHGGKEYHGGKVMVVK